MAKNDHKYSCKEFWFEISVYKQISNKLYFLQKFAKILVIHELISNDQHNL